MTVSVWQAEGSEPIRDVDVLVVGAGLVGLAAAYFFRQAGRSVTITDTLDIALGASSRNAGFMITGPDTYYHHAIERWGHDVTREVWKISETTHRYWRTFAQSGGVRIINCGSMLLAESAEEAKDLELAARALHADGIPVELHTSDPLKRGYFGAIHQPWDGAIQPYELAQEVFKQSGAELVNNNEVYAITQPTPTTVEVRTRKVIFRAQYVMLCTNAYSALLDPYFEAKIIPTRGQCLITAPLKNSPILNTCGYSDYGYMYYRDTFDGRLLIGGGRKQNKPLENNTTEDRTTKPVQDILDAYLKQWFPDVDVPVERRWSGIMGFSVDGLPQVGTLPGKPRVGFAGGCTGHGLALGAAVAERAVDRLLNGKHAGAVDARRLD